MAKKGDKGKSKVADSKRLIESSKDRFRATDRAVTKTYKVIDKRKPNK
jgi:hypothetical protein